MHATAARECNPAARASGPGGRQLPAGWAALRMAGSLGAISIVLVACIAAALMAHQRHIKGARRRAHSGTETATSADPSFELRRGRTLLQPGEAWAAGPHYLPPPHPAVERIEWESPTTPFAGWLTERAPRQPVVLANTHCSRWRASGRWSPQYLSERLGHTYQLPVRRSPTPIVQYYNHELRAKTEALHADPLVTADHRASPKPPQHPDDMSMGAFWEAVAQQPETRSFVHASVPLLHDSHRSTPLDELVKDDMKGLKLWTTPGGSSATKTAPTWQLWMGSQGVTSALHYDQQHNIYVQLHGTKRFLLSPPSAVGNAKLFPRVHACHRHSILDLIGWPSPPETRALPEPTADRCEFLLISTDLLLSFDCVFLSFGRF